MLKRRSFVCAAAGVLARRQGTASEDALDQALAQKAAPPPPAAGAEYRNRQSGIAYRRLGRTGFQVSEIAVGGNTIREDNYEHVLLALDMGANYLDTAPAYGNGASERGYARVLRSRKRDSFFLNSKVSLWDLNRNKLYQDIFNSLPETDQKRLRAEAMENLERRGVLERDYFGDYFRGQRGEMEAAALSDVMARSYGGRIDREKNYRRIILESVDQSLARLGTDHLDILMCPHGASSPSELLDHPEIFEAFEALRKQGKVRHLGVSAHNDPAGILEAAAASGVYSVAMVAYSIINARFVDKAIRKAEAAGVGVIAMKAARPVFSGRPNSADDPARVRRIEEAAPGALKRPQKAYLWVLRNPRVSAAISEMITAEHVRDNLPLARARPERRSGDAVLTPDRSA